MSNDLSVGRLVVAHSVLPLVCQRVCQVQFVDLPVPSHRSSPASSHQVGHGQSFIPGFCLCLSVHPSIIRLAYPSVSASLHLLIWHSACPAAYLVLYGTYLEYLLALVSIYSIYYWFQISKVFLCGALFHGSVQNDAMQGQFSWTFNNPSGAIPRSFDSSRKLCPAAGGDLEVGCGKDLEVGLQMFAIGFNVS